MFEALAVLSRWLHITSMTTLVGGILFARLVTAPAVAKLSPDSASAINERMAALYRPLVYAAIAGLLLSGTFNLVTTPGHRPFYHMLLGIKMLLALHVFAVAILIVRPANARRTRLMTGTLISGLLILAISAWLRRIF